MFELARLLVRNRRRKLAMHYGWFRYANIVLMFVVFACVVSAAAAGPVKHAPIGQLQSLLIIVWASWVLMGITLGNDLGWTIQLETIVVYPVSGFVRLYVMAFLLGFLSFPLLGALFVIEFLAFLRSGFEPAVLLATLIGAVLYIASIRLTVSFARAAIVRGRYLSVALKAVAALAGVALFAYAGASILHPRIAWLLPGYHLGLLISGQNFWLPFIYLVAFIGPLAVIDAAMQRDLIYSGIRGPLAPEKRLMSGGGLMVFHPAWPGSLFRIPLLCWLRSRSALLLLIWGTGYGFFYMYLAKPGTAFDFFLFVWMQLLFYGHLRGNLLGTDRGAVWLYYMFPVRIERVVSAKNQSLSLLQSCMIAGVLLGGFLSRGPGIPFAEWVRVMCYAVSSVVFGEICGFFFSIRYPDPIDRTSQSSGGTSVGALLVPLIQLLFLGLFMLTTALARRFLLPAAYWSLLMLIPSVMFLVRFSVLPWVRSAMLNQREVIIKKLSASPS
jgi:hypothetical protein